MMERPLPAITNYENMAVKKPLDIWRDLLSHFRLGRKNKWQQQV